MTVTRSRLCKRSLRVVCVIGVIFAVGLVYAWIATAAAHSRWTTRSGEAVPRDFLYAMFPVNAAVPLCDTPRGVPIGTLTRALVNSHEEISGGGWVAVRDPGRTAWAPLSELTFLPLDAHDAFAAFASAYKARAPNELRDASFQLDTRQDPPIARLRLKQENHWQEYVYEATRGSPKAIEMYQVFGPGRAFDFFSKFASAASMTATLLLLTGVGRYLMTRGLPPTPSSVSQQPPGAGS